MGVSAQDVKALRERSGAGMMDCKKALQEADGDIEKASEILREKGLAKAVKKAGRIAAEGIVESYISPDERVGVLVEINSETDFVAKTDEFKSFVKDIARHIAVENPIYVSAAEIESSDSEEVDVVLMNQPFTDDPEMTIMEFVTNKVATTGENINIRRFARFAVEDEENNTGLPNGIVESYIHMGGKIGVLLEVDSDNAEILNTDDFKSFVRDIAMHIAATNPMYLSEEEIEPAVLDKEREILTIQALNEGKPQNVVDKMVEGRIKKFKKEICLLDQPFVKDPDITIKEYVDKKAKETGDEIKIRRFVRYEMGEGLEKKQNDFAKEVAEQAGL